MYVFPSVLWHCWLGDRKGIRPVKNWMLVCWWWWIDWSFARLIAPVVQLSPPPPSSFALPAKWVCQMSLFIDMPTKSLQGCWWWPSADLDFRYVRFRVQPTSGGLSVHGVVCKAHEPAVSSERVRQAAACCRLRSVGSFADAALSQTRRPRATVPHDSCHQVTTAVHRICPSGCPMRAVEL